MFILNAVAIERFQRRRSLRLLGQVSEAMQNNNNNFTLFWYFVRVRRVNVFEFVLSCNCCKQILFVRSSINGLYTKYIVCGSIH